MEKRKRGQDHSEKLHLMAKVTVHWPQGTDLSFPSSTSSRLLLERGWFRLASQQHSQHQYHSGMGGDVEEKGIS